MRPTPGAAGGRFTDGRGAGTREHVQRGVDPVGEFLHRPRIDGTGDQDPVGARGEVGGGAAQGVVHSPGAPREGVDAGVDEQRDAPRVGGSAGGGDPLGLLPGRAQRRDAVRGVAVRGVAVRGGDLGVRPDHSGGEDGTHGVGHALRAFRVPAVDIGIGGDGHPDGPGDLRDGPQCAFPVQPVPVRRAAPRAQATPRRWSPRHRHPRPPSAGHRRRPRHRGGPGGARGRAGWGRRGCGHGVRWRCSSCVPLKQRGRPPGRQGTDADVRGVARGEARAARAARGRLRPRRPNGPPERAGPDRTAIRRRDGRRPAQDGRHRRRVAAPTGRQRPGPARGSQRRDTAARPGDGGARRVSGPWSRRTAVPPR